MADTGIALGMEGVGKRFPGTVAVDDVDFTVYAGEVHALVGENGAGKSTLMKMLAGAFDDYTGRLFVGGREVALHSPAAAKAHGIQMIHQELSLAPPLSIAENVLAGRLPTRGPFLDRRAMFAEARRCLARVGLDLDPETPAEEISQHEAQLVEIAKALGNYPCILVMDEPTSALSRDEVARLFGIIRALRRQGLAIVYISHHLSEVLEIADRVTVLRDGRKVVTEEVRRVTPGRLVEWMVGRSVSNLYAERRTRPGAERLRVECLSRWGFFHDVSFGVRAGEILGIGGLSGAGRSELARSICGIDPVDSGLLQLDGCPVRLWRGGAEVRAGGTPHRFRRRWGRPWNYDAAIKAGLAYLTEDRKTQGLALRMSLGENILASLIPQHCRWGVYSARRGAGLLAQMIGQLDVHPPEPRRLVGTLSGGNQQKALLAKWLATAPQVLFLDEPTRGVDVGAKVVIHRAITEAADQGRSVVLISSDLPELVGLSDRIMILRRGRLAAEIDKAHATEASVLLAANGEAETAPA